MITHFTPYLETLEILDKAVSYHADADNGAVDGEPDEAGALHEFYHGLAGKATADEGGEETYEEHAGGNGGLCSVFGKIFGRGSEDVLEVEECLTENGGE